MSQSQYIKVERKEGIFLIGLNRPEERNAINTQMIIELSNAMTEYEDDSDSRCAVLYAEGMHFTFGLELQEVADTVIKANESGSDTIYPENNIDPWSTGMTKRIRTKPLICAVHGFCLTLGIELMLACDIVIAAEKTKFSQLEVQRGIMPFGGATIRFVRSAGWGNAMRYLLTGDVFSAEEAYRLGLVQEIVPKKDLLESAIQLAKKIAEQAPLAIKATLANSRKYVMEGEREATKNLVSITAGLLNSQDGKEGIQSFLEKRKANFLGK